MDTDTPGHYPREAMQATGGKGFSLQPTLVPLLSVPPRRPFVSMMPSFSGTPLSPPPQGCLHRPPPNIPPTLGLVQVAPATCALTAPGLSHSELRAPLSGGGRAGSWNILHPGVPPGGENPSTEQWCVHLSGGHSGRWLTARLTSSLRGARSLHTWHLATGDPTTVGEPLPLSLKPREARHQRSPRHWPGGGVLEGKKNTHLPPDLMELLRPSPVDPLSTPGAHPERERGVPSGHSAGRQCGQVLKPKPYGAVLPPGSPPGTAWTQPLWSPQQTANT